MGSRSPYHAFCTTAESIWTVFLYWLPVSCVPVRVQWHTYDVNSSPKLTVLYTVVCTQSGFATAFGGKAWSPQLVMEILILVLILIIVIIKIPIIYRFRQKLTTPLNVILFLYINYDFCNFPSFKKRVMFQQKYTYCVTEDESWGGPPWRSQTKLLVFRRNLSQ